MARTFRRRRHRHEYRWVLRDWNREVRSWVRIDAHSPAGRKAIARFHSDATVTLGSTAPRWYRKVFDHRIRTANDRAMRRWLADPEFEPVFVVWHKHNANWSWW